MKRVLPFFLLFFYLTSVSGMSLNLHWCGGKLASIDLFETDGHNCPCGTKGMKSGCCKDKVLVLKMNDAHKKNDAFIQNLSSQFNFNVPLLQTFNFNNLCSPLVASIPFYYPPPPEIKISSYLKNCVFRI